MGDLTVAFQLKSKACIFCNLLDNVYMQTCRKGLLARASKNAKHLLPDDLKE